MIQKIKNYLWWRNMNEYFCPSWISRTVRELLVEARRTKKQIEKWTADLKS